MRAASSPRRTAKSRSTSFDRAAGDGDLGVVDGQLRLHELFPGLANVGFGFHQVLLGDGARIAELAGAAILILGGFHVGLAATDFGGPAAGGAGQRRLGLGQLGLGFFSRRS